MSALAGPGTPRPFELMRDALDAEVDRDFALSRRTFPVEPDTASTAVAPPAANTGPRLPRMAKGMPFALQSPLIPGEATQRAVAVTVAGLAAVSAVGSLLWMLASLTSPASGPAQGAARAPVAQAPAAPPAAAASAAPVAAVAATPPPASSAPHCTPAIAALALCPDQPREPTR